MPKIIPETTLYQVRAVGTDWKQLFLARSGCQAATIARGLLAEHGLHAHSVAVCHYRMPEIVEPHWIGLVYMPEQEPRIFDLHGRHVKKASSSRRASGGPKYRKSRAVC